MITKKDVINALIMKGQQSKRYKLSEVWELNLDEIVEALNGLEFGEEQKTALEAVKTKKNDRDILVIKTKSVMKRDKMKEMYRNLLEQKQCGIILLDDTFDVMVVKDIIFSEV